MMKTKAAMALKAGAPLTIAVDLEGPRAGEVLIEVKATDQHQPRTRRQ